MQQFSNTSAQERLCSSLKATLVPILSSPGQFVIPSSLGGEGLEHLFPELNMDEVQNIFDDLRKTTFDGWLCSWALLVVAKFLCTNFFALIVEQCRAGPPLHQGENLAAFQGFSMFSEQFRAEFAFCFG